MKILEPAIEFYKGREQLIPSHDGNHEARYYICMCVYVYGRLFVFYVAEKLVDN